MRNGDDLVFHLGVLENALGAEHFLVLDAEELHFLGRVSIAVGHRGVLVRIVNLDLLAHGEGSQNGVIDGQVVWVDLVRDGVVGTLNYIVFVNVLDALQTERVPARQGERLFLVVVVVLVAYAAFKDLIHIFCLLLKFNYVL